MAPSGLRMFDFDVRVQNDMSTAREVLPRILLFGIVPGGVLAALFMAGQTLLPAAFTTDAAVIAAVANVVPLLAICMVRKPLNCRIVACL